MKRILALYLALLFLGCSYAQKDVKTLLEDPLTVNYQKNMDDLERSYLHKEISYPQYLDKKKQLDNDYAQGVKVRTDTIEGVQK